MDDIPPIYLELWERHNQIPIRDENSLWNEVIDLAKKEEPTEIGKRGIYGKIPLESLLNLANKVRSEPNSIKRYELLTEKSPIGSIWFDILTGLRDELAINTLAWKINQRRWHYGLDLGTGDGILARNIEASCDHIIGVDRVSSFLKIAQARKVGKEQFTLADVLNLPFDENSFDLASSSGLIWSFNKEQVKEYVSELARVLKPGGSYFQGFSIKPDEGLSAYDHRSLANAKGILADLIVDKVSGKSNIKDPFSYKDLRNIFVEKGFGARVAKNLEETAGGNGIYKRLSEFKINDRFIIRRNYVRI